MHFFLDHETLETATSFGPDPNNLTTKYNVTTQYSLSGQSKAFACQESLMLVFHSTKNNLVNVVLRPKEALDIPFPKIQFYVYKGLLKSSFLTDTPAGVVVKAENDADSSDFIKHIWRGHKNKKEVFGSDIPDPTPASIGFLFDPFENPAIEDIFDRSFTEVTPRTVLEGEWIGDFGASCGLEIITDTDHLALDVRYFREPGQVIDVSELENTTAEQKFIIKTEKEKILNYIDPAAFWGMHYETNFYVFDPTRGPFDPTKEIKKLIISPSDLYTKIISKHSTKNRVYLDIRSEYGYSYNFYQNYEGDLTGNNLKFKTRKGLAFTDLKYEENWPIFFNDGDGNEVKRYSRYFIQLRVNDNIKPLIFVENRKILSPKLSQFINEKNLLDGASTEWTKNVELRFPNIELSGTRFYVANYLRLQYFRQTDNPGASPSTVLENGSYLEKGVKLPTAPLSPKLSRNSLNKRGFLTGNNFGCVSESGVYYNTNNVIFDASNFLSYQKSKDEYPKIDLSGELLKLIKDSPQFPERIVFNKWQVAESASDTADILEIVGLNKSEPVKFEDMFLLGLTKAEFETLNNLAGLSNSHSRLILFKEIPNQRDFNNKIPYKKYSLEIQGLDDKGTAAIIKPAPDMLVYGSNSNMLCSKDFVSSIVLPNLLPDPGTLREFEHVGKFFYDPNDPIVTNLFLAGEVTVPDFGNDSKEKNPTASLIGEVFFPVEKEGETVISPRKPPYPLVVVIHGNGHRYSAYRDLCSHLAQNGFIAASISCLMQDGTCEFLLHDMAPDMPNFWIFRADAFYLYCNDQGNTNPNFEFEKLTVLVVDTKTTPPTRSFYLLPWKKDVDFEIENDSSGKPENINFKFEVGDFGMGALGRANLLYPHLQIIKSRFGDKVQDNIGIMGHSRGGEAVLRAAKDISSNTTVPSNLRNIASIISLAPTDEFHREVLEENIPYFVLYGSKDGDIRGERNQFPRGTGFSLWDRANNNKEKSMAFVYGATHNGFITDNQDWTRYFPKDPLLTAVLQQNISKSYFNAFFRMTLKDEPTWKLLFTGELKSKLISTAKNKGIYFQYQDKNRSPVDDFEDSTVNWKFISASGKEKNTFGKEGAFSQLDMFSSPHDTKGLELTWVKQDKLIYKFSPAKNVEDFGYVSFRIAKKATSAGDLTGLRIQLASSNKSHPVFVNKFYIIPTADHRVYDDLAKSALTTIRIPLSEYANNGVNLTDIEELSFLFPDYFPYANIVHIDSIEFTD